MGASASVRMLYKDSLSWFHQYFDTEVFLVPASYSNQILLYYHQNFHPIKYYFETYFQTYMDAFKSIDKHNENALSFTDVKGGFEFILFVCCDYE
jgi:hypothetical protein